MSGGECHDPSMMAREFSRILSIRLENERILQKVLEVCRSVQNVLEESRMFQKSVESSRRLQNYLERSRSLYTTLEGCRRFQKLVEAQQPRLWQKALEPYGEEKILHVHSRIVQKDLENHFRPQDQIDLHHPLRRWNGYKQEQALSFVPSKNCE